MIRATVSSFNPELFIWARSSAGLTLPEAADALNIKVGTLESVEAGQQPPSRPLLLRMSKTYRRSLLIFYLPIPPALGDRGHDFRTVAVDRSSNEDADVDALVRDLKVRQSLVKSILEDDEDSGPIQFVGSARMALGIESVSSSIQETIGFNRSAFRKQRNAESAFGLLRKKVEDAGVFVLLIGNLGSHHSSIPIEAFRGFAIADPIAPFIVINDQDAKTAWSFTLLHELAHLWLGATGVSGARYEQQIEQFCNAVAADILLPASEIKGLKIADLNADDQIAVISRQAGEWNVSRQMLTYGLYKNGNISQEDWQYLDGKLREMWIAERKRDKEIQKTKGSKPTYYVVRRHRLGSAILAFAARSLDAGTLSPSKAAMVLGVSPRGVFPLLKPSAASEIA